MNKILIVAVIIALSLVAGITTGLVIENSYNILGASKKDEVSSIPSEYINMVENKHDKELVIKAYNYLNDEQKRVLDYTIKPEVRKLNSMLSSNSYIQELFPDGYYSVLFMADGKLYIDYAHNSILIGIDAKNEKKIYMFPID
ncbi:MAG: hypothetical protein PHQ32_06635 [Firmicutes bacterium]|nr:hypothetical protein [Bacillota bacterium]